MPRISFSRFGFALASAACAALLLAQPTFADGQKYYTDSQQENPAALDITQVSVNNHEDGSINVLVAFKALSNLPPDTDLVLLLDTDQNRATGDRNGMEYEVWLYGDDNTYEFLHWNGTGYDDAGELTVRNLPIIGVWIGLNRSQIGDVDECRFYPVPLG